MAKHDLWKRLTSNEADVQRDAFKELHATAKSEGKSPTDFYAKLATDEVAKENAVKKSRLSKSAGENADTIRDRIAGRERVSFASVVLGPVSKAAGHDDVDETVSKAEESEMEPGELKRRGLAASKSAISFSNVVFPIEDQEQARQPRGADHGAGYEDEVMGRIGGSWAKVNQTEPGMMPHAGTGGSFEGTTQDIPTRTTPGWVTDASGITRWVANIDPTLGSDGGYDVKELGELGDIVTRVGENYILSPQDPGISPASPARFPVSKEARPPRPRGLFRSVIEDKSNLSGFGDK